jgi:Tfp pilus assembly protein PilN
VSQVNLLPPEILQAQRWRKVTLGVGVAGAVALVLLFGFYLLQGQRLSGVQDDIEAQNATNASIQTEIASKQKFADLQAQAQAKQTQLATAYAGEVSFSAILMDVSRIIPSDAYLDTLTVQVADASVPAAGEAEAATGLVGSISGGGQAVSIETISDFLTRLESVKGWVNPFVSTVTKSTDSNGYVYALSVDLTEEVVTPRGKGEVDAAG